MSSNALPANLDVAQLVQKIRTEVDRRLEQPIIPGANSSGQSAGSRIPEDLTSGLRSIASELDVLSSHIQSGEPSPVRSTLRGRVGAVMKDRLYRFLWWQSNHIKSLVSLSLRSSREQANLIDSLLESIGQLNREVRQTHDLVLESSRRIHGCENQLRQLESAQLRLQAAEIERNVKQGASQLENEWASIHQDLTETRNALSLAEARMAEQIRSDNDKYGLKIDEVAQRLEIESAQKGQLSDRLSEFEHQVAAEYAEKERMSSRLGELAQRIEAESSEKQRISSRSDDLAQQIEAEHAQKEQLANRLSELGLFTHQTRAALSIQDRRLSLFLEEARQRMPDRFTSDQVENLANKHAAHKYDSLYMAFEDVFRGSREEIKARQSVYLQSLKERGIGSSTLPLLDLGCGRGEWLELLGEHGLEARGVDNNQSMVEKCKSEGLNVNQSDALSHLRTLSDSSLGAVTSFHMVEHLPFEVTLTLIDEALRVLRPGGVLILETPNPQNLMVGAHTFYLDPTHLKPLPSPMLRFFVEARGFCDAHILELQPYPETVRFPENGSAVASRLNYYLYGPQDYAVIGRKP